MTHPIEAVLAKVSTLVDGTLRITFDCNEMEPEQIAELFEMRQKLGRLFFEDSGGRERDFVKEISLG